MKNLPSKLFVALSGIMALGVSVPAVAQSANGTGTITIVRPLTVTNNQGIKFGTIIKPTSGAGSVAVTAAESSARTVTGTGSLALASGDSAQAAKFTLDGEGGQVVSVTVPATFSMTSGAASLLVTTSKDIDATITLSNTLASAGTKVFYVGGSVPLEDTTVSGAYSGTFEVTASYN